MIKAVRALLITLLVLVVGLPVISYLMLSTDWAQRRMRLAGEEAVVRLLGTPASIGEVHFSPFNRINLHDIVICDDNGDTCLNIASIMARVEIGDLLLNRRITVDYAIIDRLDGHLSKADPEAPLNIQGIISRFKKNEEKKPQKKFSVRLNNIEIVNSDFSYDVLSEPTPEHGVFDPNHIGIKDLNVEVYAPVVSSEGFAFQLRRLAFIERSDFEVSGMHAKAILTPSRAKIENLSLELPNSMLAFGTINADLPTGYGSIAKVGIEQPDSVEILPASHIYLPDLGAFAPVLRHLPADFSLSLKAKGMLRDFDLAWLNLAEQHGRANFSASGHVTGLPTLDSVRVEKFVFRGYANSGATSMAVDATGKSMSQGLKRALNNEDNITIDGNFSGTLATGVAKVSVAAKNSGGISAEGRYRKHGRSYVLDAKASLDNLDVGNLLGSADIGAIDGDIDFNGLADKAKFSGEANARLHRAVLKGYAYTGISLEAHATDTLAEATLNSRDPNMNLSLHASLAGLKNKRRSLSLSAKIKHADLDKANLWHKFPDHFVEGSIKAHGNASSLADFDGIINISGLQYVDSLGQGLRIGDIDISANRGIDFNDIFIECDALNGYIKGHYDFATLASDCQSIVAEVYPGLLPEPKDGLPEGFNDFGFDFTIEDTENICKFFNLSVYNLDPIQITGWVSEPKRQLCAAVDAEWLFNGDKLIRNTYIAAMIDGAEHSSNVYATSFIPTKKGPMNVLASIDGADGLLTTNIDWEIVRDIPINGEINFSTLFTRSSTGALNTLVEFSPGQINFGNDVWQILPASIFYSDKYLAVNNFSLQTPTQSVKINGTASESEDDVLSVDINNVNLIDIFETLEIDKALLCGQATGQVDVSSLFTAAPRIQSTTFTVKGIGYNRCVIGDADIDLGFDVDKLAFCFDAIVTQKDGRHSTIVGSIVPATEELDLNFDADHVPVGFMQPFMEAFCSGIEGYATGKAHLFGTFKYIDLTSDNLVADELKLKIDFTNTWYHVANAPLDITPGLINIPPVTIKDDYGNSAKLSGWVKHVFFKEPSFDFDVKDARNFLCYDMPRSDEFRWWGTVYGNGGAHVDGVPGEVNIGVTMTTCEKSHFTFELSDAEVAEEYSFITFRDATPQVVAEQYYDMKVESQSENRDEALNRGNEGEDPTAYNMNIQVDITPQAKVTLVMDPVGGDEINATGNGQMRMFYGSRNDVLTLNGKYTLIGGSYNFTLQDIIIKDFIIRKDSSIQFDGDPYAAKLDINAVYEANVNLSDLDESFLSDQELKTTRVKVLAVMKVTGNMLQPDISFDLEFPNLNDDISRKVHSIVSTEDMMNRQIIYLLALNRFYTPDYMASTTKGNELFSVASSTISSQLSSMLGKLSDNWSIAPNLRSDRGDFSDVEVDVNLSSRLLNNRLLFNGNFGYRDKSLNTNQFVGDFDVEYLLNRPGTLRLRAYNRYNDQNYYLRTAQTTQGIGITARRDFDSLSDFFGRKKRLPQTPADTSSVSTQFPANTDTTSISQPQLTD